MSLQLIKSDWRDTLLECTQSADYLLIVCPFIKAPVIKELLAAFPAKRVEVITRMNTADFYDGVSDTKAIRMLLEHGAKVRALKGLHTKLYIFSDTKAIVGSANLTASALDTNLELGHLTTHEDAVFECIEYFDELWVLAANDVTLELVDECDQILQTAQSAERPKYPRGLKDFGTRITKTPPTTELTRDIQAHLNRTTPEVAQLFRTLQSQLLAWAGCCERSNKQTVVFHVKNVFAECFIQQHNIRIQIRVRDYNDPHNMIGRVPPTHNWTLEKFIDVYPDSDLEPILSILKQSYEDVL